MPNLLDSLFPEEGQLARLRAAYTGQGATPERVFQAPGPEDRFASASVGNSSVYPPQVLSTPRGELLSSLEGRLKTFKESPVTNALMDASSPLGTLAGVGAKLVNKTALRHAQHLETTGALPETIWNATGFFRDKAGNWAWEIDDSGMKIKTFEKRTDTTRTNNDTPGFYDDLPGGWASAPNTLYPHLPKRTKVGDVIEHPELFANYPHLAEMPIKDSPCDFDLRGAYSPDQKMMYLNAQDPARLPEAQFLDVLDEKELVRATDLQRRQVAEPWEAADHRAVDRPERQRHHDDTERNQGQQEPALSGRWRGSQRWRR